MKNKSLKIAFILSIIFYIIFHTLYYLKLEYNWWNDNVLVIFMPLWTIGIFITAYMLTKKYLTRKNWILNKYSNNSKQNTKKWKTEKELIKAKVFSVIKFLSGATVPFLFYIYYKNNSLSTLHILIIIVCILLVVYFWYKESKIKRKYGL